MTTSRMAPGYTQNVGARSAVAVTPSDTTELADGVTGIYIGGAGNVVATMADGTDVTFNALAVGVVHYLSVKKIKAATTATNIVALY